MDVISCQAVVIIGSICASAVFKKLICYVKFKI